MVLSKETALFQKDSIKDDINGLETTVNGAMKETVSIYQRRNDDQTPAKPGRDTTIGTSVTTDNQWEYVMPQPKKNCRFWTCEQYTQVDGDKTYSDVRELTNDSYISKWVSSTDNTYIDGGALYAHSVTADQINTNNLIAETSIIVGGDNVSKLNNDSGYQNGTQVSNTATNAANTAVNNLNIGGRNLVWDTSWLYPTTSWAEWGSPTTREIVTIDGKRWLHLVTTTTQYQGYQQNEDRRSGDGEVKAGDTVVASFLAYARTSGQKACIGIHWRDSGNNIISQNWYSPELDTSERRYSTKFTVPAGAVSFNIMVGDNTTTAQELWIAQVKLEKGNKLTDWSPAPEDGDVNTYITKIDNTGISIHPRNTTANRVEINSVGVNVYRGDVSVAEYGDTTRVGKENGGHTTITSAGMKIYGSDGTVELANIGYGYGKNKEGETVKAPYYTFGTRAGAIGNNSVAEGANIIASNSCAHAEGSRTQASGISSHAEGAGSLNDDTAGIIASGFGAHAEGMTQYANSTSTITASGRGAHAEGSTAGLYSITASGDGSHAEGCGTTASGNYSHAGGFCTIASGTYQTAIGRHNVSNTSHLFIVGNGLSDNGRSNALTVTHSGDLCTKGLIYVGANADGTGGRRVGQPEYERVFFPFTPTKPGILLTLIRAQAQGRVYIGLSNAVPTMTDGWTVSDGYINGVHFCNANAQVSITDSSNMISYLAYYVTWT